MKNILLHTCCAPCSIYVLERLKEQGFAPTIYYYNPNIHPRDEYVLRLEELKRYCEKKAIPVIEAEYDAPEWFKLVKGLEHEPEKGNRCEVCFTMRLKKAADYARENGFEYFGTSLTISPHKDAVLINKIGREMSKDFYEADWKKNEGFKKACELSRLEGFYRQNYCGCIYSKK